MQKSVELYEIIHAAGHDTSCQPGDQILARFTKRRRATSKSPRVASDRPVSAENDQSPRRMPRACPPHCHGRLRQLGTRFASASAAELLGDAIAVEPRQTDIEQDDLRTDSAAAVSGSCAVRTRWPCFVR